MLAHDDPEVGRDLHHVTLAVSSLLWRWTRSADVRPVDGNVLLALAETKGAGAVDVSDRSGLPLDVVYPALHRLTDRGYVLEEHRRHRLTADGQRLVADFDRFSADASITPTKGMS